MSLLIKEINGTKIPFHIVCIFRYEIRTSRLHKFRNWLLFFTSFVFHWTIIHLELTLHMHLVVQHRKLTPERVVAGV